MFIIITACSSNKNLAQTNVKTTTDSLLQHINHSTTDTKVVNPHLVKLAGENDLVIAFGTLNYAWTRTGKFYVLTSHNNAWQLYTYEVKLPFTQADETAALTPQNVSPEMAEKIKKLCAASELWQTNGDKDGRFCSGKNNCNITDAETWTISIATQKNIHTTTYYAPQFFEECCPGNPYRQRFVAIAKEMMALGKNNSSAPEK